MGEQRTVKISQSGLALLQEALYRAELEGYWPDSSAAQALYSAGLDAPYGVETIFVVDPMLDGPVYPFMEWPAELAAARRS